MVHLAVVGGGIVGAATLEALSRAAHGWKLTLIEKEPELAFHQSGRNSGVIHSGIYYRPGSLKARFCQSGVELLERFCRRHNVPFERRGKLITASHEVQRKELSVLLARGKANGVVCRQLAASEAKTMEPRLKTFGAIEVPGTGIVDFAVVTKTLAEVARQTGAEVKTATELIDVQENNGKIDLHTSQGSLLVDGYINCTGLHSDQVARMAGLKTSAKIVPFRGEYYRLRSNASVGLSGRLIYPVPDPRFPFLGVHLTPTLSGDYLCGPNAVLALAREGYSWGRINLALLFDLLTDPGFRRLVGRNWRFGLSEMRRSLSVRRFASEVEELVEGIDQADLEPAASGVRAQLVSRHGELVDDFRIESSPGGLHLLNAPSPAATASLAIGRELAGRAIKAFG